MKRILLIAPIFVLIVAVVLFVTITNKKSDAKFATADVQRGDIVINVTATGSLEAVTTVQVGSQISGTIEALYADFNDLVRKGQILAQLDPTFLKAQVAQAQADLEKAQASADLSKSEYDRALSLYERNMISESDRDAALTNYQLAAAEVKSAQANLDRSKTNLTYATILSPIDGVVISRNVDVGQTVAASLQAPTLYTIAQDLTKMEVKTSVDEADIGKIQEGQKAVFTVDAYPERIFEGRVKQIRLLPEVVQNVVSYDVILEVSNPEMLLKPGMTANVTVEIERADDVLKVPATALRFHPNIAGNGASSGESDAMAAVSKPSSLELDSAQRAGYSAKKKSNTPRLWVLDRQGNLRPVAVQVGISDGLFTEVISADLKEGEQVVVGQENGVSSSNSQQVNPFMPRFGGRGR